MKKFVSYVFVTLATLYTGILYGSSSFIMLFLVELLLPLGLLLTTLPARKGIRVQLRLPITVAEKGKKTPVEILIRNQVFWPVGRIAVQVTCTFPMSRKKQKTWFYGRVAPGDVDSPGLGKIRAEYDPVCVGGVRMEITQVKCYDLLGFLALPLPKKQWRQLRADTLLVLPNISEVPIYVSRQCRDFAGESEEFSKERGGDDPSEIFQIRDYQPGDKLRSVHWKLSAKTEELMVRENSLPLGCPVVFYLDLHQIPSRESSRGKKGAGREEGYLQIAASICQAMVREGCRHYLVWFERESGDIQRCRIETEEDIYEMLFYLGSLQVYQEQMDLEELYYRKYHETHCVTRLTLQLDYSLHRNGDFLWKYNDKPAKLEKQLMNQEIMV